MSTKSQYVNLWIFRIIDFLLLFAPLTIYTIVDFMDHASNSGKIILIGTIGIAGIITVFNFIAQKHLRSPIWIIFLGLYATMKNLIPLIIMLGIASILDEFVFTPIIRYYKRSVAANIAIDKRIKKEALISEEQINSQQD